MTSSTAPPDAAGAGATPHHLWARAPAQYRIDAQLAQLKARYAWLNIGPNAAIGDSVLPFEIDLPSRFRGPMDWLYAYIADTGTTMVEVEPYIDLDYHDEFSNFYAYTFKPPPARCERLHLWMDADRYLGYASIRPVPGSPICRSILTPAPGAEYVTCRVQGDARPFGDQRRVHGFPFLGQDSQYSRCAHAAVWMVSYYHHLANRTPRYYLSDIVKAAEQHEYERVTPSAGLTDTQVGVACNRLGVPARQYTRDGDNGESGDGLKAIITRYLDSGIPIILCWWDGVSRLKHMTVAIGYRRPDTQALEVVQHDDLSGAYSFKRLDGKLHSIFVPIPERVYLSGHAAAQFAEQQWESIEEGLPPERRDPLGSYDRLDIRTYLTHSRRYKSLLGIREVGPDMHSRFRMADFPRWIWVAEIHDVARRQRREHDHVIGELVIDATSDRHNPRMIVGAAPGELLVWGDMAGEPADRFQTDSSNTPARYLSGVATTSAAGVRSSERFANVANQRQTPRRRPAD